MSEVRITNPQTGGQKGSKPERYDLVPVAPLAEVARLYGAGASKYDDHNWRRGYDWSLSISALLRHVAAFRAGESIDEETGTHHLASVVFHAFALMEFEVDFPYGDDRYVSEADERSHAKALSEVLLELDYEDEADPYYDATAIGDPSTWPRDRS